MEEYVEQEQAEATAGENISALFETVKDFGETNIDLIKLKAAGKAGEIVSSAVAAIVIVIIMLLFIIILSIGIALLLGDLLGKSFYGFFALAGLYLIIGLILNSMKEKWFKNPIANLMIKKMFK